MKTAIQQAREEFKQKWLLNENFTVDLYTEIDIYLESLEMIERQQIFNAFCDGDNRGKNNIPLNAEQYYSKNYGQNEN